MFKKFIAEARGEQVKRFLENGGSPPVLRGESKSVISVTPFRFNLLLDPSSIALDIEQYFPYGEVSGYVCEIRLLKSRELLLLSLIKTRDNIWSFACEPEIGIYNAPKLHLFKIANVIAPRTSFPEYIARIINLPPQFHSII